MAYKGGVPVNSGFYPRNDFPIVDAKDIYVLDTLRLDALSDTYILNIDYDILLAFDTNEIVSANDSVSTAKLGVATLGAMTLGRE